jgi:uncharacterized protein YbjT (DUF2867 family)
MRILVTGTSGYIGARLAPRLLLDGHEVRGMSRGGGGPDGIEVAVADAVSGLGLDAALAGIEVAYYLIHSMEPGAGERFEDWERAAAENFAQAASKAGVRRIVYLGGLVPVAAAPSPHLGSRLGVERILLGALPDSVTFRASIVIGTGSRSFRLLVRLIERMPVLLIPAWHRNVTRPIDERDVVEILARAATASSVAGLSLDIGGPNTVSYGQLIERIRDHLLIARPAIRLGLTITPIASRVSAVIAGEEHALIGPLMGSLGEDLLPRDERATELLGVRTHSLDAAIEHALREWEEVEPLAAR